VIPSVRRTWVPRGETTVLHNHLNWKSIDTDVDGRGDRHTPEGEQIVFGTCTGSYNDEHLIEFIRGSMSSSMVQRSR